MKPSKIKRNRKRSLQRERLKNINALAEKFNKIDLEILSRGKSKTP